jgi:hypothetical protein
MGFEFWIYLGFRNWDLGFIRIVGLTGQGGVNIIPSYNIPWGGKDGIKRLYPE